MTNIAVIGAGAWGLALADYAARIGNNVCVWDRSTEVLDQLRNTRTINRPKGLIVDSSVQYADDLIDAVKDAEIILSVVPSYATADICRALKPLSWNNNGALFVNCSKGIEEGTLRLPSQIFEQEIGTRSDLRYAVLAGPSHAEEVTRSVPTCVVASAHELADAEFLQKVLGSPIFRVYIQLDYTAVELGGAMKNVIAIAAGISDAKGFGDNTKAALITRGVAETARLAVAMNASAETVAGLSGLGDLIVTAMSKHSRNRHFGDLLVSCGSAEAALEKVGAVVEGYRTAKSTYELSRKYNLEMPLVATIYEVLYENLDIEAGIAQLLDRDPHYESLM